MRQNTPNNSKIQIQINKFNLYNVNERLRGLAFVGATGNVLWIIRNKVKTYLRAGDTIQVSDDGEIKVFSSHFKRKL